MADSEILTREEILARVDAIYRLESRRILATLIRLLGDFDLAEEALQEAFRAAVERWPSEGVPDNPRPWLVSAGRFKAIDALRRRARFDAGAMEMAREFDREREGGAPPESMPDGKSERGRCGGGAPAEGVAEDRRRRGPAESGTGGRRADPAGGGPERGGAFPPSLEEDRENDHENVLPDDRLRLIFTCCHPALAPEARVALTLREVCGLTTEEIARAFLAEAPTVAQRIVRAKAKIREARIPYAVPGPEDLPERLDAVLRVLYLVFNEGYSAAGTGAVIGGTVEGGATGAGTTGSGARGSASATRADLSGEAIRLGRLLAELLPEPEAMGLLALMLLHESRRNARVSNAGELILLDDQDRSLWNRDLIREGSALAEAALRSRRFGPYTLQAAIAAVHAEAAAPEAVDWAQIAGLYDVLLRADPSPIVELNRAVAVAMRDGAAAGLRLIDGLLSRGELADYHLAHSARADLLRRLDRKTEAAAAYRRALGLARQEPDRRFLEKRIFELETPT